jgi:hypothetical protein
MKVRIDVARRYPKVGGDVSDIALATTGWVMMA